MGYLKIRFFKRRLQAPIGQKDFIRHAISVIQEAMTSQAFQGFRVRLQGEASGVYNDGIFKQSDGNYKTK